MAKSPGRQKDELGRVRSTIKNDTIGKAKDFSRLSFSETVIGGTVCGKAARTGLWGRGEVTILATRTKQVDEKKA